MMKKMTKRVVRKYQHWKKLLNDSSYQLGKTEVQIVNMYANWRVHIRNATHKLSDK